VVISGSKKDGGDPEIARETTKNSRMKATVLIEPATFMFVFHQGVVLLRMDLCADGIISTSGGASAANCLNDRASALELARLVAVVEVSRIIIACRPSGCMKRPSFNLDAESQAVFQGE